MLDPLLHDADAVRRTASQILSRPPFVEERPGLIGRALRWVADGIAELLAALLGAVRGGSPLGWLVVALVSALLVGVVLRLTRGTTAAIGGASVPSQALVRSSAEWERLADEAEAAGERREAIRLRYAALVAALGEAGIVEDRPGLTVGELDRIVEEAAPDLASGVVAAGERFEAVWYGRSDPTGDDLAVIGAATLAMARRKAPAVVA